MRWTWRVEPDAVVWREWNGGTTAVRGRAGGGEHPPVPFCVDEGGPADGGGAGFSPSAAPLPAVFLFTSSVIWSTTPFNILFTGVLSSSSLSSGFVARVLLRAACAILRNLAPPDSSSGKRLPGGCDSRGSLTVDIQSLMASSKGRAPISMGREGGTGWRQDPFWCGAVESRPEAADDASSSCCRARGPLDVRQLRPGFE
mmetsp:Transcript_22012/g.34207  ORF Transcript_22012/g.34207 Transcript_22012/m.34207 type:complete len:200 (-) Transcript_22012:415-1014(-)